MTYQQLYSYNGQIIINFSLMHNGKSIVHAHFDFLKKNTIFLKINKIIIIINDSTLNK